MSRLLSRARDDEDAQGRRRQRRRLTSSLPGDLFAGMTLWAVFAAQAIAYSRLAHATPVAGLVTTIAGATTYALLGTSRRNSIGPAGGIAAIVGAALVFGNARKALRDALAKAGMFTMIEENEFVADVRAVRATL